MPSIETEIRVDLIIKDKVSRFFRSRANDEVGKQERPLPTARRGYRIVDESSHLAVPQNAEAVKQITASKGRQAPAIHRYRPEGTGYGEVMKELKKHLKENSGDMRTGKELTDDRNLTEVC